ncbi:hypothetical protein [Legionella impletisoli]|uniref:Uncharacterized protein n=1 Tax=Legionella impletisoli TaxID=343510 RepID=A0A917ND35_9GAMM|nr:hypothetical protein [Legionella impletisoli]GGI88588.1 hypothetical protein GCM10007966_16640 [Legionella impletisoli]
MRQPRIFGYLFNCGLHLITPELKNEISQYAKNKNYNNQHNDAYHLLKDCFADFYGFNKKEFSWEVLDEILAEYNPFETQLILGPVLRRFMESKIPPENVLKTFYPNPSDRMGFTTINEDGRYRNLGPDELGCFVTKHLGFTIIYQKEAQSPQNINADNPITQIYIHHHGSLDKGHWERTSDVTQIDGSVLSKPFQDIALKFGEGQRQTTLDALEDLKHKINPNIHLQHRITFNAQARPDPAPNYSFLLKAGAFLASALCVAAFAVAALAWVGLVVIGSIAAPPAAAAFALAGLGAGVCAYGLFKTSQRDNSTIEPQPAYHKLV